MSGWLQFIPSTDGNDAMEKKLSVLGSDVDVSTRLYLVLSQEGEYVSVNEATTLNHHGSGSPLLIQNLNKAIKKSIVFFHP